MFDVGDRMLSTIVSTYDRAGMLWDLLGMDVERGKSALAEEAAA